MASRNPIPFIYEIENKKKKQHLAHELGAGSPCEKCKGKCPGFDLHYWRKVCKNCRCGKKEHGVTESDDVEFHRIGKLFGKNATTKTDKFQPKADKFDLSENFNKNLNLSTNKDANRNQQEISYDWVPPNTDSAIVQKYMNLLPENLQPITGSTGALHRKKLIELQLPIHDLDSRHCHDLTAVEIEKMNEFIENCKKHVGIGLIGENGQNCITECKSCTGELVEGDLFVYTEHSNNQVQWHPKCFSCSTCNNGLADLIYFHKSNNLYCGRHFAEICYDRCSACDELIFTDAYTKAEGKNWHIKHFCCYDCDKPLAGFEYTPSDDGHPHCLECYSYKCSSCSSFIPLNGKRVSYQNLHWHASDECFRCSTCNTSLMGQRFLVKSSSIFCSVACRTAMFPK